MHYFNDITNERVNEMRKKIGIAILLIGLIIMSCGCGNSKKDSLEGGNETTTDITTAENETTVEDGTLTEKETTETPTEEVKLSGRERNKKEYHNLKTETLQYMTEDEFYKYNVYETWVEVVGISKNAPATNGGEGVVFTIPSEVDGLPVKVVEVKDEGMFYTVYNISKVIVPDSVISFYYDAMSSVEGVSIEFQGDVKDIYFRYTSTNKYYLQFENFTYITSMELDLNTVEILISAFENEKDLKLYCCVQEGITINVPSGYEKVALWICDADSVNINIPDTCETLSLYNNSSYGSGAFGVISVPKTVRSMFLGGKVEKIMAYKGSFAVQYAYEKDIECEIIDK